MRLLHLLMNLDLPVNMNYSFNSINYSSGIYFYRLQIGNEFSRIKKDDNIEIKFYSYLIKQILLQSYP